MAKKDVPTADSQAEMIKKSLKVGVKEAVKTGKKLLSGGMAGKAAGDAVAKNAKTKKQIESEE